MNFGQGDEQVRRTCSKHFLDCQEHPVAHSFALLQLKKLLQTKIKLLDEAESSLSKAQKELCTLQEAKSLADKARRPCT